MLQILQAGRVSADKGVHTSVEAIGYLAKKKTSRDFSLLVAGSGPIEYERSLLELVSENHIEDRVTFQGWAPRETMPALMAKNDVLLLPTPHPEPFSRVVLEAMVSGMLVVGTNTGGTGELLRDGVNSLVFPAENSEELAKQLLRILDNDELRCQLARQGQQQVLNEFSLEKMIDKLEELLLDVYDNQRNLRSEGRV
jgi:glycosyltransferase involved in cell wall biosynthesis